MWFGGFKSHQSAEALWVLMHIDEMGAVTLRQPSLFVFVEFVVKRIILPCFYLQSTS